MTDEEWATQLAEREPRFVGSSGALRSVFVAGFAAKMMQLAREDERKKMIEWLKAAK